MNAKTASVVLSSLLLVVVAACGDDKGTPVGTAPSPVILSLKINGSTSSAGTSQWGETWLGMAPGERARLTATGTFSDGAARDVTADVVWTCSDTGTASVLSPGEIVAVKPGWGTVSVRSGSGLKPSALATVTLRVAPAGVFLLDVAVDDGQVPLDAAVTVTSPAGTFRGTSGIFYPAVFPAVGETVLDVSASGYAPFRKSMTVSHDDSMICTLKPSGTTSGIETKR
jgi:hypothetical protein